MLARSRLAALNNIHGAYARHRCLTTNGSTIRDELRTLLRDTAQPVAIVTARMDPTDASPDVNNVQRFHGATLSSFSSIAMDPYPLVAFSLRIPSRMVTALTAAHASSLPPASTLTSSSSSSQEPRCSHTFSHPHLSAHMVINILSSRQAPTAVRFSRPDLHPTPFAALPYTLSREGLPVLSGAVGALSCRLVAASWPLHDLDALVDQRKQGGDGWEGEGVASELFIAQVVRVEKPATEKSQGERETRPLLYYRRGYVTTHNIGE